MKKLVLLALATLAVHALAVDYTWLGTQDSNWQNPANWDAVNGAPSWNVDMNTNRIIVRNRHVGGFPLKYTDNEGTTSINYFTISNGDFIIEGGTLCLTNSTGQVSGIGGGSSNGGALTINGGLLTFHTYEFLYVSENGTSNAVLTVNGGEVRFYEVQLRGRPNSTMTSTINLNGGLATLVRMKECVVDKSHANYFNFNGGLLRAAGPNNWAYEGANANYGINGAPLQIRDGGMRVDTASVNCDVTDGIQHSDIAGDNPIDGGIIRDAARADRYFSMRGTNTYTGATISNAGIFRLMPTSNHAFFIKADGSVNSISILGGTGQFQGVFNIVPEPSPFVYTSWQLVEKDASVAITYASATFGLELNGEPFENTGGGIYELRGYEYDTATGILTRKPLSTLLIVK